MTEKASAKPEIRPASAGVVARSRTAGVLVSSWSSIQFVRARDGIDLAIGILLAKRNVTG